MPHRPHIPQGRHSAEPARSEAQRVDNPGPAEARRRAAARAASEEARKDATQAAVPRRTPFRDRMRPGYGRPVTPRTRAASHADEEHGVHDAYNKSRRDSGEKTERLQRVVDTTPHGTSPANVASVGAKKSAVPKASAAHAKAPARGAASTTAQSATPTNPVGQGKKPAQGRPSTRARAGSATKSLPVASLSEASPRPAKNAAATTSGTGRSGAPVRKQGQESRATSLGATPAHATPRQAGGSVARSSAVMFMGTFVSRVLGMVRSPILLGAVMGMTSPAANSFAVANKLPNLIYMIVVGGLVNAVLVPSIVRATKESDDSGEAFLNKLITLTGVFLGAVTLVLTLGAPVVVRLFASQMSHEWYSLAVAFAFWCMPQVFFYGMYTVLGQILNARENFGPYMWAPVVNNVVAIAGFAAFLALYGSYSDPTLGSAVWTADKVALLGGMSTLGIACQALVLVWPMRKLGIRYRPDFRWRGTGLGAAGKASWWMLLTMLVSFVPTAVLSNVSTGTATRAQQMGIDLATVAGNQVYDTAYMYYSLPTSLIVVSIATAVFTRMAKSAVNRDMAAMRADTSKTLRLVSTLMFASSAGMIALAVPIIRVLGFTVSATEAVTVARVLVAMSLGLAGVGAVTVLNRVYYAFEDTRGAFWAALPFQVLGVVGFIACGFLPPQWTVVGIGCVMSLSNVASALYMLYKLAPRMGGIDGYRLLRTHVILLFAACVAVFAAWIVTGFVFGAIFTEMSFLEACARLVVGGIVVMAAYVGVLKVFKAEELALLTRGMRSILGRFSRLGGRR